ncbi:MAG: hypothetical protein WCD37_11170 [Chloroflexia bacterium]
MSEAIRGVQEGQIIELIHRGEAVALLVPIPKKDDQAERRAALARLGALADEIAQHTPGPVEVTQLLSEMRRY